MRPLRDFVSKFLLEVLIIGMGSLFSILWLSQGRISALEVSKENIEENIILLRNTVEGLRVDNREDHKDILKAINARS